MKLLILAPAILFTLTACYRCDSDSEDVDTVYIVTAVLHESAAARTSGQSCRSTRREPTRARRAHAAC